MIETPSDGWKALVLGRERALRHTSAQATVLFGIGPPQRGPGRLRRASSLLEQLRPAVRALRWCDQVHGTELVTIAEEAADGTSSVGHGDGLITAQSGVGLMVWTADCVPVLLTGTRVVAAVHAGWRGAAAGIVPIAVERCTGEHDEPRDRLTAHLGPAISGPRYPVGPEVIAALGKQRVEEGAWLDGKLVDLRRFLAAQLADLGVASVQTVGGCTASTSELASFRRDGAAAGRQWSLVYRSE
jgi:YfiH family protein